MFASSTSSHHLFQLDWIFLDYQLFLKIRQNPYSEWPAKVGKAEEAKELVGQMEKFLGKAETWKEVEEGLTRNSNVEG